MAFEITREIAEQNLQILAENEILKLYAFENKLVVDNGSKEHLKKVVVETLKFAQQVDDKDPIFFRFPSLDKSKLFNARVLEKKVSSVFSDVVCDLSLKEQLDFSQIQEEPFEGSLEETLESGVPAQLKYQINQGKYSKEDFKKSVCLASKNGLLDSLRFLFMDGRRELVHVDDLEQAICIASENGNLNIVRFLLFEGKENRIFSLKNILLTASKNGQIDVVRFLLLFKDQRISPDDLIEAISAAYVNGHTNVVQILISGGEEHSVSQEDLGGLVYKSSEKGFGDVIRLLLSQFGPILTDHLGYSVLIASQKGHPECLEVLFQYGGVLESVRQSAITQAEYIQDIEVKERVLDLLNSAPSLSDSENPLGAGTVHFLDTFVIDSFDAVRENSIRFFTQVALEGLPRRVALKNSPKTIDLGGLTKQFLTTLFQGCCNNNIFLINERGLPIKGSQDLNALEMLGKVFNELEVRNQCRTDRFLTGELFDSFFYALTKDLIERPELTEDELVTKIAREYQQDQIFGTAAQLILNPLNVSLEQTYKTSGLSEKGESSLVSAKSHFAPYAQAIREFVSGLNDNVKERFQKMTPQGLKDHFEGKPCTKEALLEALSISESPQGVFQEHLESLKNAIQSSDLAWRQRFVQAVTGNRTLTPGKTIKLKLSPRKGGMFEMHTCFNTLDLPQESIEKEQFLTFLNTTLDKSYNTA